MVKATMDRILLLVALGALPNENLALHSSTNVDLDVENLGCNGWAPSTGLWSNMGGSCKHWGGKVTWCWVSGTAKGKGIRSVSKSKHYPGKYFALCDVEAEQHRQASLAALKRSFDAETTTTTTTLPSIEVKLQPKDKGAPAIDLKVSPPKPKMKKPPASTSKGPKSASKVLKGTTPVTEMVARSQTTKSAPKSPTSTVPPLPPHHHPNEKKKAGSATVPAFSPPHDTKGKPKVGPATVPSKGSPRDPKTHAAAVSAKTQPLNPKAKPTTPPATPMADCDKQVAKTLQDAELSRQQAAALGGKGSELLNQANFADEKAKALLLSEASAELLKEKARAINMKEHQDQLASELKKQAYQAQMQFWKLEAAEKKAEGYSTALGTRINRIMQSLKKLR